MRKLISSLGLVMFLALSNHAFGQFSSKEYLLTIGDLVTKKGFSEHNAINPLQKLYYVHLLQPDYLWRDLTTMIRLSAETGTDGTWSFVDNLNTIVKKIRWSNDDPIEEPVKKNVKEFITVPLNEASRKEPYAYMNPVVIKAATEEVKPLEKKALVVNKNPNNTSKSKEPVVTVAVEPNADGELLVPESLNGIISDDYIEYGSIGFYANAAVIHPSYEAEMASIAEHLNGDLTLELIIHGHCNGTTPRTIIAPGLLTRFFEIDNFHEQKTASAKELSEMRAEYARRYLVSQGINEERIQIIGEGGGMMIYPPASEHARYNDRVEFEIIKPANHVDLRMDTTGVD
jgi:outer membrane protein OmpA-like peptidoglycan-associated protein